MTKRYGYTCKRLRVSSPFVLALRHWNLDFWANKFTWSEEAQILKSRGKNINYLCTGKRKMEKTINESLNRNIKECRDVLNIMLNQTLVNMNAVNKQGNGN